MATANNRKTARDAVKTTTKPDDENKALRVIAKREGFRRAGRVFGSEPADIPIVDMSEAEYLALTTEPMLVTYLVDLPQQPEAVAVA